jgi:hypothetical protein
MKTLLICHEGAHISQHGLACWLASFSDLVGIIVLEEKKQRVYKRIRREIQRVGLMRFADVGVPRALAYSCDLIHHGKTC